MEMSKLEKLDAEVSRLGFGAMRLPLLPNGKIDRVRSAEMVDLAYRSGVNYFDTAYGYHNGESEEFLGEALSKYPRESYYLADKMPMFFCDKEADVERIFSEQLKRCRVDYFDFYLMHSLGEEVWDKAMRFSAIDKMLQKKKSGQIRRFGFSYHGGFSTFVKILDYYDWDFVQLQLNYIDYIKLDAKAFYDELTRRGIPCVVMEPVRGGFLANLPPPALEEMDAGDNSRSAEWAFRWLFGLENTPVILSGMSSLEQVTGNLKIFASPKALSQEEYDLIGKAREVIFKIQTVPCTGCAYCANCPSGVDIPKTMRIYNEFKLYGNTFSFMGDYDKLADSSGKSCTGCDTCKPLCPQGIDIPHWLDVIAGERAAAKL